MALGVPIPNVLIQVAVFAVGSGTLQLLREHADLLEARTGRRLTVTAVSAREPGKRRNVDLGGLRWHAEPQALAADPEVDVVCELIGGSEEIEKWATQQRA